jgi:hypothetical protein
MPMPSGSPEPESDQMRASRTRLRGGLLLAVVAGLLVLALVVVTDPRRIGVFETQPGRSAALDDAAWTRAAPAPVALTEVAAAVHDGRIWVVGGMDSQGRGVDLVQIYDPGSDTWSAGPAVPVPIHHGALVADDRGLLLVGGYAGVDGRPTDAVWRLAADGTTWVEGEPLLEARAAGAAAWDGRDQVLYGGGVGPAGVSATVFARAADGRGWRELAQLSTPREHLAATSFRAGSVTFLGGRVGGLDGNLGTIDIVSSADGVVGRAEDLTEPRGGIAAFSTPTLGDCAVGGEGPAGTFGAVECVDAVERTTLPGLTVPRHGLGAVALDGRAYVLLGGPQPGLTVSDVVEVLDLP